MVTTQQNPTMINFKHGKTMQVMIMVSGHLSICENFSLGAVPKTLYTACKPDFLDLEYRVKVNIIIELN